MKVEMLAVASQYLTLPANASHSHSIVNKPYMSFKYSNLFPMHGVDTMKNAMFKNFFTK
jgi:hypothetical protein